MNKSITTKGWLVKMLSSELMMSETVIDAVIDHAFEMVKEKMLKNDTVEIAGFGKFIFNRKKALRKLDDWRNAKRVMTDYSNDESINEIKRKGYANKVKNITVDIDLLEKRIYENR